MPPEEPPPLAPPDEGMPPPLDPPLWPPLGMLLEDPPEEPPLEPEEPDEPPDEPLGMLEGIDEDEDCCCWAQPPISIADTELTSTQCTAIVSRRRDVSDELGAVAGRPVAGIRVA